MDHASCVDVFLAVGLPSNEGIGLQDVYPREDLALRWQVVRQTLSPRNPIRWAPNSNRLALFDASYRSIAIEAIRAR